MDEKINPENSDVSHHKATDGMEHADVVPGRRKSTALNIVENPLMVRNILYLQGIVSQTLTVS